MTPIVPEETPAKGPAETKTCVVCDSKIPRDEKKECPVCQSAPDGTRCKNCQKRIPIDAKFCNTCKEYQNWRKNFAIWATVISVTGAFIGVSRSLYLAAAYLSDRQSHTNFKFVSANSDVIFVTVWNTGQRPSAILGGRLNFGDIPIDDVELELPEIDTSEAKNVIPKEADRVMVALTIPPFQGLRNHGSSYTKESIQQLLNRQRVTLYLNVEESDGDAASPHGTFTVDRIKTFIIKRMYK